MKTFLHRHDSKSPIRQTELKRRLLRVRFDLSFIDLACGEHEALAAIGRENRRTSGYGGLGVSGGEGERRRRLWNGFMH